MGDSEAVGIPPVPAKKILDGCSKPTHVRKVQIFRFSDNDVRAGNSIDVEVKTIVAEGIGFDFCMPCVDYVPPDDGVSIPHLIFARLRPIARYSTGLVDVRAKPGFDTGLTL